METGLNANQKEELTIGSPNILKDFQDFYREMVARKPGTNTTVLEFVYNFLSIFAVTDLNLGRRQYREEINDPSVTRARLTGLKPDMDYRIYLSAATSAGAGEAMFLDARTTPAGGKSGGTSQGMALGN